MSDENAPYNKPTPPFSINPEVVNKAQEALKNPQGPEAQEAIEKGKSFYEENKRLIITGVVVLVGLRVYRKKIAKATAKTVSKVVADAVHNETGDLKLHLNELTMAIEELGKMSVGMHYPTGSYLHSVANR